MTQEALLREIRSIFEEAANPSAARGMMIYMKDIAPYFGIAAPARRKFQREIFDAYTSCDGQQFSDMLSMLLRQPERELHYLAMDWLYHTRQSFTAATIHLLEHFLTTKSWWDTVDFLSTRCLGAWAAMFPKEAKPIIRRYIQSDNFWLNRSAILHQLHYGANTDTALLVDCILPHAGVKEFFVQKAIGWALRHYARTNPVWVREFVNTNPLAALSRREALKHL